MSRCGATADPKTGCRKWRSLETMCQKNCDAESGAPTSPSLLEEDDPGPLSSQQQATSSRDKKPLSSLHLSHRAQVALEYLPFFCTYGCLLEEEGLVLQPETWLQEDSELLSGFFPYYRSEEESLPSLALPGWSHRGSQDLPTEKEAQAGSFCRTTVRDECSGPWSLCPRICAYYRTPEEGLHTSPGPPASPSGIQGPSGSAQGWCSHTTGKPELTAAEATGEQAPSTHRPSRDEA
ncbi:uncharacterized protein [Symphalangus syndactylus]|uniref:uncharacterized protein isoform X2 n=1 Tax=Symphalangus syndactylus TaxID=9590 RepID=UPI00244336EE|nr:uncharacterized protein LOC129493378 isoform X2 [Symphalangus syndactylus]